MRISLVALFIFSASAYAWTVVADGIRGWQTSSLQFHFSSANCPISAEELEPLVDQALAVWNSVPASGLTVSRASVATSETPSTFLAGTATEVPLILCDTDFSTNHSANPNGVPAGTRFGSGSPLSYAGIFLNAESGAGAEISNFTSGQIVVILAHEIGHALGLGHSSDSNALMYYSISGKTTARLTQDDRDGISYLYPRNEFSGGAFGCASARNTPAREGMISLALIVLIFLLGKKAANRFAQT